MSSHRRFSLIMVLIFGSYFSAVTAFAQVQSDREGATQIPQDQLNPLPTLQDYHSPGTIPSLSDILKNVHGSYSVSFMGPRLTGASDETYNIYLPDKAPVQLYHTLKLGYQINPDLQIGFNEAIANNVADNVTGFAYDSNGNSVVPNHYGKTFQWYDPNLYFFMPNLIKVDGWYVQTSASFSLPFTQDSQDIKRITQFIIQQSWTKNTYPSKWSWGFHLYLNPQFYTDPIPSGYTTRETLSFSFGHSLSYQVSDLFTLSTSTTFDVEHDSPDPQGFFHLGQGLPDYLQIKATVFPHVYPIWMSIAGYFQTLIWNPAWETAIVGASFSVGF
jgi:hypothetical protein